MENQMSRLSLFLIAIGLYHPLQVDAQTPFRFEAKQFASDFKVGYAVSLGDLNGDKKLDIIVVDQNRVVWYENPTWQPRMILEGKTKPDNVCIVPIDIDGDQQLDLVLGADWKPFNTRSGGTLQWLKRGKTLEDEWSLFPIAEEPTVHRVKTAVIDESGKPTIILSPLMGRNSTKERNWMDGQPVRTLAFPVPKDPEKGPWNPIVLDESVHVSHNIYPFREKPSDAIDTFLMASYEGVSELRKVGQFWKRTRIGEGNQAKPESNRGASEIKRGLLRGELPFIATIEPWHGNQVVVYTPPASGPPLWQRHVIDEELQWGHGVWCADLDGDGSDELIIGVRDNQAKSNASTPQRGVRVYRATSKDGSKWDRTIVENGGVAVEDLAAGDLDNDGQIDIVAVGRATGNGKIYWNRTK
jgi:hypothetical protein